MPEHRARIQPLCAVAGDALPRGGSARANTVAGARLPLTGDKTLKLHDPSLCAYDLSVNAVGASAKQRNALAALVGNGDLVDAIALGAPQLARLGRQLIALAGHRQKINRGRGSYG